MGERRCYNKQRLPLGESFTRTKKEQQDGYYAISTRVYGVPLERVPAAQWLALVPAIVAALEAMHTADLSATEGFGGWGADGHAAHPDWRSRLLEVAQDSRITGVFDWGCSVYGDHLYDLALFEFWSPWQPQLDVMALRTALEQRWGELGFYPENKSTRLKACYLHIGLEHLAYHAQLGNCTTLLGIAQRMRALVPE
jgi:hygromycin-B 4-O-kinase